jgi:hypothetical protein
MRLPFVGSTVALMTLYAAPSYADPAACRAEVIAAFQKSSGIPNHTYSQVKRGRDELVSQSERINIGNKSYVKSDQHGWSLARVTPQDMAKLMLQSMRDAAKEAKKYNCARARDETVDAVAATVYSEHAETEDTVSDSQTWISKSQGLIVRHEVKTDDTTATLRYVYTDIQAPVIAK